MAISFSKNTRKSSIIMSEEAAAVIIDAANDNSHIQFQSSNPKIRGTETYKRWAIYSSAQTVAEYLSLNNNKNQYGDLHFAIQRGHIKILD